MESRKLGRVVTGCRFQPVASVEACPLSASVSLSAPTQRGWGLGCEHTVGSVGDCWRPWGGAPGTQAPTLEPCFCLPSRLLGSWHFH